MNIESNLSSQTKLLLVEDESHLAFTLQFNLQQEGFTVTLAADGASALSKYESEGPFDVIIMDVMLPEINGFEVVKKIREKDKRTGIIMLTARASDHDRMKGLGLGVDDYITKPFHLQEFLMRAKRMAERARFYDVPESITSRAMPDGKPIESGEKLVNLAPADQQSIATPNSVLRHGPIELNSDTLQLTTQSGKHHITALESDILKTFIKNKNKVLSRTFLLDQVWKIKGDVETRTVDNFIVRLRKYLEKNPAKPEHLISVRGRGYQLIEKSNHL